MRINKILWPTDFSSNAQKALPFVKSIIREYGAQIHVIYVVENMVRHESWYDEFGHKNIHQLMALAERSAEKHLDQICDRYLEKCPLYVRHVAVGDPAREILKRIEIEQVDMVVMATHGEKGEFRFGSVAEKVMKNSPVPVTLIPIVPDIPA